jgi:hypothetical protein
VCSNGVVVFSNRDMRLYGIDDAHERFGMSAATGTRDPRSFTSCFGVLVHDADVDLQRSAENLRIPAAHLDRLVHAG